MTRPWWVAHVVGIVVVQAAMWLGYVCFYRDDRPAFDGMLRAMTEPLGLMEWATGLTLGVANGVIVLVGAGALSPPRWRDRLMIAAYMVVAAYWLFACLIGQVLGAC